MASQEPVLSTQMANHWVLEAVKASQAWLATGSQTSFSPMFLGSQSSLHLAEREDTVFTSLALLHPAHFSLPLEVVNFITFSAFFLGFPYFAFFKY